MKKYEIMYILNANLTEEVRKGVIDKLHACLINNGDKITEVNEWGSKELAYDINNQKRGYYIVITVEALNDLGIKEFDRQCRIDVVNIIRHLTINL